MSATLPAGILEQHTYIPASPSPSMDIDCIVLLFNSLSFSLKQFRTSVKENNESMKWKRYALKIQVLHG